MGNFHQEFLKFFGNSDNFFYGWNLSSGDEEVYGLNIFTDVFKDNIGATNSLNKTFARLK